MDDLQIEVLLSDVFQPVDPPERFSDRLRDTFSLIRNAAADDLAGWADELTESELNSLKDPRNWVRPVFAVAAGGTATGVLVLVELRRRGRRRRSRLESLISSARSRTGL
ncbi:MAG: hypothetical protein WEB05_03830 [Solirubrobacterales bacterium]